MAVSTSLREYLGADMLIRHPSKNCTIVCYGDTAMEIDNNALFKAVTYNGNKPPFQVTKKVEAPVCRYCAGKSFDQHKHCHSCGAPE